MLELVDEAQDVAHRQGGAVGVADKPSAERELVAAAGAGIVATVEERLRRVMLWIVERNATLQVRQRGQGDSPRSARVASHG
jgi:hypothetical protein